MNTKYQHQHPIVKLPQSKLAGQTTSNGGAIWDGSRSKPPKVVTLGNQYPPSEDQENQVPTLGVNKFDRNNSNNSNDCKNNKECFDLNKDKEVSLESRYK